MQLAHFSRKLLMGHYSVFYCKGSPTVSGMMSQCDVGFIWCLNSISADQMIDIIEFSKW